MTKWKEFKGAKQFKASPDAQLFVHLLKAVAGEHDYVLVPRSDTSCLSIEALTENVIKSYDVTCGWVEGE